MLIRIAIYIFPKITSFYAALITLSGVLFPSPKQPIDSYGSSRKRPSMPETMVARSTVHQLFEEERFRPRISRAAFTANR